MSTAFSLLNSADDWEKYKTMYAQAAGYHAAQVAWGGGPDRYPCLVASYKERTGALLAAKKVLSCYVYVSDAEKLMESAGTSPSPAEPPIDLSEVDEPRSPTQHEYNHGMAAHMGAILQLLIDTGIITPEQYEKRYLAALSQVD